MCCVLIVVPSPSQNTPDREDGADRGPTWCPLAACVMRYHATTHHAPRTPKVCMQATPPVRAAGPMPVRRLDRPDHLGRGRVATGTTPALPRRARSIVEALSKPVGILPCNATSVFSVTLLLFGFVYLVLLCFLPPPMGCRNFDAFRRHQALFLSVGGGHHTTNVLSNNGRLLLGRDHQHKFY